MAVRRITADRRELIRQLADILSTFLPLNARSKNTITFRTIFAQSNIEHYLEGEIKRQALQCAWESVFRYHPKLPYTLIRKIVPAAVGYRRYKRDPLKREELELLTSTLKALGVDMGRELLKIELDETVPEICVPPKELVRRWARTKSQRALRWCPCAAGKTRLIYSPRRVARAFGFMAEPMLSRVVDS